MTDLLTAPEYATLLAAGRPRAADVTRAALVDLLARGALRLETRSVPAAYGRPLEERLVVAGRTPATELPQVLRPGLAALDAGQGVLDVDGRPGVRVRGWADGLTVVTEGHGYLEGVVRPALVRAGLLDKVSRRFLPGSRWGLTTEGRAVADTAARDVARARAAVQRPAAGWDADPVLVAAAVAALGALGALALADRGLVDALLELRRTAGAGAVTGGDDPVLWAGGYDTGGLGGALDGPGCGPSDPFDGLDCLDGGGLDSVDAGTGGGWDSGGWGGDSGGDSGGDFGGDSGGGDGGGGGGD